MAHPYKAHHQDKVGHARAKDMTRGYWTGGGPNVPRSDRAFWYRDAGPKGSIERKGVNVYRRELGRGYGDAASSTDFGGRKGIRRMIEGQDSLIEKPPLEKRGGRIRSK